MEQALGWGAAIGVSSRHLAQQMSEIPQESVFGSGNSLGPERLSVNSRHKVGASRKRVPAWEFDCAFTLLAERIL